MKKVLFVLSFALFLAPAVVFAAGIFDDIRQLDESGKMSNGKINHSVIEYVYLPETGTVTAFVYQGDDEKLTVKVFENVAIQDEMSVRNKITRFVFELTNRYRPYGTDLALSTSKTPGAIDIYTSGTRKDEAMWNVVNGIPDALYHKPIAPGEDGYVEDWVDKYSPRPYPSDDDDDDNDGSSGGGSSGKNENQIILNETVSYGFVFGFVFDNETIDSITLLVKGLLLMLF